MRLNEREKKKIIKFFRVYKTPKITFNFRKFFMKNLIDKKNLRLKILNLKNLKIPLIFKR